MTELEYIETTGTQYIDLNYYPKNNTKIVAEFNATNQTTGLGSRTATLFGTRITNMSQSCTVFTNYQNTNNLWIEFGASNDVLVGAFGSLYGKKCTLTFENGTFNVTDGTNTLTKTFTSQSSFTGTSKLFLFDLAINSAHADDGCYWIGKLYSFKIYEGDTLVFDGIPVKDSNGDVCLFDKISNTFFYNAGTGDFVAGPIFLEQLLTDSQLDYNNWTKVAGSITFSDIFDSDTKVNTLTYRGADGYEHFYTPVTVEANTDYIWHLQFCSPTGFSCSYGQDYEVIGVTTSAPTTTTALPASNFLAHTGALNRAIHDDLEDYTVSFNSGNNTTIYLVVDTGYMTDGQTVTLKYRFKKVPDAPTPPAPTIKQYVIFDGANGGFTDPSNAVMKNSGFSSNESFSVQGDHIALKDYPTSYISSNCGFYFNLPIDLDAPELQGFTKLCVDIAIPYGGSGGWTQCNLGLRYYSGGVPTSRYSDAYNKLYGVAYTTMARTLVEWDLTTLNLTENKFYFGLHEYGTGPWVYKVYLEGEFATRYYLIESGGDYYTLENGTLVNVGSTLDSQLFKDYGVNELPSWSDYSSLPNPSVLCWNEEEFVGMTATTVGTPTPQTIITENISLDVQNTDGIDYVTITDSGAPKYAFSVDSGTTWKIFDGTDWITSSGADMATADVEALTEEEWALLTVGVANIKVRVTLSTGSDAVGKIELFYKQV